LDSSLAFQTAGASGAIVNEAGNNVINGPISLRTGGSTTIRSDGDTLTLAGNINILANVTSRTLTLSGPANGTISGIIADGNAATNILSLTKSGTGIWTLTAANTYTDVTTINGGTLTLGASGSISNTASINLQSNAAFNVSALGTWALGAGQSLTGGGIVAGNVSANGSIAPGSGSGIGALTFSNTLSLAGTTTFKLNRTNTPANADSITATTLACGGTVNVTNVGDPLQAGDTFTLFNAGSISGSFATVNLPALSGSLYWSNTLTLNGKVTVASTALPQPYITHVSLTSSNLVMSGTNGTAGGSYHLLSTTNVALPLNQWAVIATNTFNAANFTITNVVDPTARRNFYILRVP
jgi:autotransporter-associated beta strand protein